MITITRCQARRLRGVFRRHVLGITHRGSIPPLVFRAEGTQLRAQYRYAALALETVIPGDYPAADSVALPLDALGDIEGREDSPVVLEAAKPERTIVHWEDHGIPRTHEYDVAPLDKLAEFPAPPAAWESCPAELLTALAETSDTTSEDVTRYAINCMRLRGSTGEIAASDGHQLLIRAGFHLPWNEDVLVHRSLLFGCRGAPHDGLVMLGRTETFVVLRVGAWTLFLEIQKEKRFPVVEDVVFTPDAAATRLRIDPEDATFLASALERLPGAETDNASATVVLNGRVAVRAQGDDDPKPTELVLTRSRYRGTPLHFYTSRVFLGRALRFGLTEIEILDPRSPIVCRDAARGYTYAWQPLTCDADVPLPEDVIRIESCPTPTPAIPKDEPTKARKLMTPRSTNPRSQPNDNGEASEHPTPEGAPPTSLSALIQDSEAVHTELQALRSRVGSIVSGLRRYRKREKLVASTLASLKELKLQEVAE